MRDSINKFKYFCKTELGLSTREDFFSAIFAIMFVGGLMLAGIGLVYITVLIMGGIIQTIVIIGISLLSIFVLGVIAWAIAYILGRG